MDFNQLLGFLAPVILTFLIQGLKKLMAINGYIALAVVFVIGGATAVIGVGPAPQPGYVDTAINAGWIIGVATFIYSLIKNRRSELKKG